MGISTRTRHTTPDELRGRLDEFEARYGVPSSRLADAFRKSPLRETAHFREWTAIYAAWRLSVTT